MIVILAVKQHGTNQHLQSLIFVRVDAISHSKAILSKMPNLIHIPDSPFVMYRVPPAFDKKLSKGKIRNESDKLILLTPNLFIMNPIRSIEFKVYICE